MMRLDLRQCICQQQQTQEFAGWDYNKSLILDIFRALGAMSLWITNARELYDCISIDWFTKTIHEFSYCCIVISNLDFDYCICRRSWSISNWWFISFNCNFFLQKWNIPSSSGMSECSKISGKTITHRPAASPVNLLVLSWVTNKYRKIGNKIDATNIAGSFAARAVLPSSR